MSQLSTLPLMTDWNWLDDPVTHADASWLTLTNVDHGGRGLDDFNDRSFDSSALVLHQDDRANKRERDRALMELEEVSNKIVKRQLDQARFMEHISTSMGVAQVSIHQTGQKVDRMELKVDAMQAELLALRQSQQFSSSSSSSVVAPLKPKLSHSSPGVGVLQYMIQSFMYFFDTSDMGSTMFGFRSRDPLLPVSTDNIVVWISAIGINSVWANNHIFRNCKLIAHLTSQLHTQMRALAESGDADVVSAEQVSFLSNQKPLTGRRSWNSYTIGLSVWLQLLTENKGTHLLRADIIKGDKAPAMKRNKGAQYHTVEFDEQAMIKMGEDLNTFLAELKGKAAKRERLDLLYRSCRRGIPKSIEALRDRVFIFAVQESQRALGEDVTDGSKHMGSFMRSVPNTRANAPVSFIQTMKDATGCDEATIRTHLGLGQV